MAFVARKLVSTELKATFLPLLILWSLKGTKGVSNLSGFTVSDEPMDAVKSPELNIFWRATTKIPGATQFLYHFPLENSISPILCKASHPEVRR